MALAVIAAHLFALQLLLILTPTRDPVARRSEKPAIAWMVFPRDPAPATVSPAVAAPALTAPAISALPLALPAPPSLTAPAADPAQAALRQYLGCRLPGEAGQWTADKERCAKMLRDLPSGPQGPVQPTEEEKQLARKFDRAQEILNSPTVVPCLAGLMVNIICLAQTLASGGDFITTYAELPQHPSEPLATGMVGRSGHTPVPGRP